MTSLLRRGAIAGAAGIAALDAISYADMLIRDRGPSDVPGRTVAELLSAAGRTPPKGDRLTALGQLAGAAAGIGVGILGAAARAAGVRLPAPLAAGVLGAAAMAAADVPAAALGVTDPRNWTPAEWLADAVPHLGYGVAAAAALRATDAPEAPVTRAGAGLVARSALLGVAAGSRSSLGLAAPTLTGGTAGLPSRAAAVLAVAGELAADKHPGTPPRTAPQVLGGRVATAFGGGTALARRERANAALPGLVAAAAAVAGSFGGLAWRTWAGRRVPDWQAAVAEDVVAVSLALLAARNRGPAR